MSITDNLKCYFFKIHNSSIILKNRSCLYLLISWVIFNSFLSNTSWCPLILMLIIHHFWNSLMVLWSVMLYSVTLPISEERYNQRCHWNIQRKWKCQSLSCVWLSATPWTAATRLLCPWEFSRQRYWSELPFPSREDCPNPGTEPIFAGRFFTSEPPGEERQY